MIYNLTIVPLALITLVWLVYTYGFRPLRIEQNRWAVEDQPVRRDARGIPLPPDNVMRNATTGSEWRKLHATDGSFKWVRVQ